MKNKIVYAIKHNSILKDVFISLGSLFFRFIGLFVRVDPNLVLFVGNVGNSYKGGSPFEIYQYMINHPEYKQYHAVWAFNHPNYFKDQGLDTVKFDTWRYFMITLRAKYWVTDVNIERSLNYKKKQTKYLNTWHGVALKRIGNDDKNSGRYDYSNLDYLCVSGHHDERVYKTALNANPNSFLESGMPRNDELFHINSERQTELKRSLGIDPTKKVILYAPTWRDSVDGGESYQLSIPVDFKKWQERLGDKYVVLFRAHDRTSEVMKIDYNSFIHNYSHYDHLNDLLIAADILITDYSSIVFDYSILEKPFICFCYDYEQYSQERGFYFDPEIVYPQGVLRTEDEVLDRIETMNVVKESSNTNEIKKQFMEFSNGHATADAVHVLFGK